jgi:hypothetical protein
MLTEEKLHEIGVRLENPKNPLEVCWMGQLSQCRDGLRAGQTEFEYWQGQQIFLYTTISRQVLEPTQPPIQWVLGPLLPEGVKQVGCEATHSLPSSAEVKNSGVISPFPHTSLWHSA